jgi:uncharacterized membrane protein YphA (DoxX/SURF4 family)
VKTIVTQQRIELETAPHTINGCSTFLRTAASSARFLLACVFLLSGISKLYAPASASTFVATILPITADAGRIIVIPLSLLEVAGGCLLLFKRWVTVVTFISSFFFLSAFGVGLLFLGEDRPCGCFGDLFLSQTDEWFLIKSLALLFLSLFVLRINARQSITDIPNKP